MSEPDPIEGPNSMILGEMRGQLREVVHSMNNLSMKFDGLTREVVALGALAAAVGKLEAELDAIKARLKAAEDRQNQQVGAGAIVKEVLASPLIAWIFMAAVAAWAFLTKRVP